MRVFRIVILLCFVGTGTAKLIGKPPVETELISVQKIWDKGLHNAFTDLLR